MKNSLHIPYDNNTIDERKNDGHIFVTNCIKAANELGVESNYIKNWLDDDFKMTGRIDAALGDFYVLDDFNDGKLSSISLRSISKFNGKYYVIGPEVENAIVVDAFYLRLMVNKKIKPQRLKSFYDKNSNKDNNQVYGYYKSQIINFTNDYKLYLDYLNDKSIFS